MGLKREPPLTTETKSTLKGMLKWELEGLLRAGPQVRFHRQVGKTRRNARSHLVMLPPLTTNAVMV
jgi:hypothetical protein